MSGMGMRERIGYGTRVSPHHRRYLLLEQGVGAALFNVVLNGAIAWAMFRGLPAVPLWGRLSIMGDTVGTSLILPLATCVIVTPTARRQVRAGRFPALGWSRASHPVLRWLPRGTVARGLTLAAACALVLAPAAGLAFAALGVAALSPGAFIVFKAAFAGAAAALVTPVIALWAIAESPDADAGRR